jgi:small neutral amino acid transporter SnatA (MarC family)
MAALEVVMTTVITMLIASFATYWTMRLSRVVFSVIGEMVGSPLM